ncbi:hypothetical protein E2C01_089458 [Portunus trituberculatus]|uniref:Uncharacterized protein n=1 Tax=Portunus trituberculatus TaxID=210409 RepID=A0A5B7JPN0_PORTR|nr:hypothetical protein [Portunus trituberculatus]
MRRIAESLHASTSDQALRDSKDRYNSSSFTLKKRIKAHKWLFYPRLPAVLPELGLNPVKMALARNHWAKIAA